MDLEVVKIAKDDFLYLRRSNEQSKLRLACVRVLNH